MTRRERTRLLDLAALWLRVADTYEATAKDEPSPYIRATLEGEAQRARWCAQGLLKVVGGRDVERQAG